MTQLHGVNFIASQAREATGAPVYAIDPATNKRIGPAFASASLAMANEACERAWADFDTYRRISLSRRVQFLQTIAEQIEALGEVLLERVMLETGLPRERVVNERARTCYQLRHFAALVSQGQWLGAQIDPALPQRLPQPRPDIRQQWLPLGPVAVFGASNFPLAFSVAGGDTAAAFAAGAPVVVKAHPAHPGTSELVGWAIATAVALCDMPEGIFSLLHDSGHEIAQALVQHPGIKAVGFTGSRSGGTALMVLAAARPEPIPVYAEMASINPVYLLPQALQQRGAQIAQQWVAALTLNAGQFCTNPGLLLAVEGDALEAFTTAAAAELAQVPAATMLTPSIAQSYQQAVARRMQHPAVSCVQQGRETTGVNQCQATLFSTQADDFIQSAELHQEIFGACALLVRCRDMAQIQAVTEALEGQLTATLQLDPDDEKLVHPLLPALERKAGRILANSYPPGVEVCHAIVHGGPYPATSDGGSSSVGSTAIQRFLRPVAYQGLPDSLLPPALQQANPWQLPRLYEGKRGAC